MKMFKKIFNKCQTCLSACLRRQASGARRQVLRADFVFIFSFFLFIFIPKPSFATDEILTHTGPGTFTANAWTECTNGGACLNDGSNTTDGTSDYNTATDTAIGSAAVSDFTVPGGNGIVKVRVEVQACGSEQLNIGLGNGAGGTSFTGSSSSDGTGNFNISNCPTFTTYWEEWTSPPGGTWNVNDLEILFQHVRLGGPGTNRVGEAKIILTYRPLDVYNSCTADSYASIQGAIDASSGCSGDYYIEAQSNDTYNESLTITSAKLGGTGNVDIRARWSPTVNTPKIDNGNSGTVITITDRDNVTIKGFTITNCASNLGISVGATTIAGTVIKNNIITCRDGIDIYGDNVQILNNTVWAGTQTALHIRAGAGNTFVRNNILRTSDTTNGACGTGFAIYIDDDVTAETFDSDYNILLKPGSFVAVSNGFCRSFSSYQTDVAPDDANSLNVDPLFVNEAGGDYHLKSKYGYFNGTDWSSYSTSNSPALDAGTPYDVANSYTYYTNEQIDNGCRVDIGAYGNHPHSSLSGAYNYNTTWVGGTSTAWNTASNWTGCGVPTSSLHAGIVDGIYDPVVDGTGANTNNLGILSQGAYGGGTLTLNSALTINVSGNMTVSSGTYTQSAGTLNITGALSNSSTFTFSSGTINLSGNYTNTGAFSHSGGNFVFNGTTTYSSDGDNFYNVEVNTTGSVSTGANPFNVSNNLTMTTGTLNLGSGTHTIKNVTQNGGSLTLSSGNTNLTGNFTKTAGTFNHGSGTVTFNGTSNQTITPGGAVFNNLTINNTGAISTVSVTGNLTVNGNFTQTSGTFNLNGYTHTITDAITDTFNIDGGTFELSTSTLTVAPTLNVNAGGTLDLTGPGVLKLTTGLSVSGTFRATAAQGKPKVTTSGVEGTDRYSVTINSGGTINIFGAQFVSLNKEGVKILDGATITRIDDAEFLQGVSLDGVGLNLQLLSGSFTFRLLFFDANTKYNVGLKFNPTTNVCDPGSSAIVTVENGKGPKGDNDASDGFTGESEDCDPDSDTHITWKYFKSWIGVQNTAWDNPANWENSSPPKDCTCLTSGPCDDVIIGSAPFSPALNVNACLQNLQIIDGGKLSLNNKTLSVTGSTFRADTGVFDPGTGTVTFTGTASQSVNSALNPFYNVTMNKTGGTVQQGTNLTVQNNFQLTAGSWSLNGFNLTISNSATVSAGTTLTVPKPSVLTVSGAATLDGTVSATDATATFNGTTALSGALSAAGGSLLTIGNTLTSSGSCSLTLSGTSTLALNASASLNTSCTFSASGNPTLSGNGALTINGSTNISKLTFSNTNANGLTINDGSKISALDNVSFTNPISSGRFLFLDGAVGSKAFTGMSFAAISGTGKNIVTNTGSTGTVVVSNYSGAGSGSTYTQADGASVTWAQAKVWAGNYEWKLQLTVTNNDGANPLPSGATVEYEFNHATMIANGNCSQPDGDDFRIFYYDADGSNGNIGKELDRVIINKNHDTGWNTTNTVVAFATQEQIPASGSSSEYWVVCGNPNVTSPPANAANVGVIFFDGFESGSFGSDWSNLGNRNSVTTDSPKHGMNSAKLGAPGGGNPYVIMFSKSTSGFADLLITYWREANGGNNAKLNPQWSVDPTAAIDDPVTDAKWTNIEAEVKSTYAYTQVNVKLPAGAENNPNFKVRWRFDRQFTNEYVWIDTIRLYANQNGSLATVSTGTWASIKNKFSEWANWSPLGVPSSNDVVLINGGYRYKPIVDAGFTNTILSLEVDNTDASVGTETDELLLSNSLTVSRDITICSTPPCAAATVTAGANGVTLGGNFENHGVFTTSGTVTFNGGASQNLLGSTGFSSLTLSGAGTKLLVKDSGNTVSGTLTVNASTTFELTSQKSFKLTGTTATVSGSLILDAGSTLDLADPTALSISGTFQGAGTASSPATVTSADVGLAAGYSFSFSGTSFSSTYTTFQYMGPCGIQISSASAITLTHTTFDNASTSDCAAVAGTESYLLNFDSYTYTTAQTLDANTFKNTGSSSIAKNVRGGGTASQHGVLTFSNPAGGFAGAGNESDPNALINWPVAATPALSSATAADASGGGAGIQFGDTVKIVFTESTNAFALTPTNIDSLLTLSSTHTWGSIVSASWSTTTKTNDTLTITLASDATVAVGDTITINGTCPNTVCDPTEANRATGSPPAVSGTFGADTPDMTSAEAADTSSGGGGIQAGDTVKIIFDKATNAFALTAVNIDSILQLSSSHSWKDGSGAIGSAAYSTTTNANDTLTITLSTATSPPTVALGDSISIGGTCPNTICDTTNTNKATGSPPNITGTFGDTGTVLTAITASDASGAGPSVQAGDKVVFDFSTSTNGIAINSSNIDSLLPLKATDGVAARTWLDGSSKIQSAVWTNANKTLTITLSAASGAPDIVAEGDDGNATNNTGYQVTIAGTCPNTICNASNTSLATGFPLRIGGDFGTVNPPVWKSPAAGLATTFQGGLTSRSIAGTDFVVAENADKTLRRYRVSDGLGVCSYTALAAPTSPVSMFNGNAYFLDASGNLYKVDMGDPGATGTCTGNVFAPVAICSAAGPNKAVPLFGTFGGATRIVAGCENKITVRNDLDGTLYAGWPTNPQTFAGQTISGAVSVAVGANDGYVYVPTEKNTAAGEIAKLSGLDGTVAATFSDPSCDSFSASLFIFRGVIYVGCAAGSSFKFFAVDSATMALKWTYTGATGAYTQTASFDQTTGRIYVGNADGNVYCLNKADGTLCTGNWPKFVDSAGVTTPVVAVQGSVYLGAGTKIYALDAASGDFISGFPINTGKTLQGGIALRRVGSTLRGFFTVGDGTPGQEAQVVSYDLK